MFSLKHFGVNDEVVHDVFTAVGGVFPHVEIDDLSGGVIAVDRDGCEANAFGGNEVFEFSG